VWHYAPVAPRVTVIIATYNWSSVLRCSVASVLRQTFTDFELLVVGDGCTDDSADVVAESGDPRVHWINLPANTGHQSGPNNEGLRRARGEIVAYLGHDDLWLPHHLASLVAAIDRTACDLAYALAINVDDDGGLWAIAPRPAEGRFSAPLSMAHRKRVTDDIGGWRHFRDLTDTPDVELWRRAQARGCTFTFVARLTGIKFPASRRRDVYRTRPAGQQTEWLARVDREPLLEVEALVALVVSDGTSAWTGWSYRELARGVLRQTVQRLRARARLPTFGLVPRRGQVIDGVRRFKGL
jgi:glycosyltransferase involved in cell wall biosynthesis